MTVVPNTYIHALDLIFLTHDKCGIGFNVIDFFPGPSPVRIDVYSSENAFLGTFNSPGNAAGTNFVGMLATGEFIGRVNIFDPHSMPGVGAEGADNIQMWTAVPEPGTLIALAMGGVFFCRRTLK